MKFIKKLFTKYPLITFLLLLVLLFAVIFIGKKVRTPETKEDTKKEVVKTITVFDTSQKLQTPITGEVDRADTIVLRAISNGIVTRALKAGDKVYHGKEIVKLSETYSGTSRAEAAAALAQRNAQFQNETSGTQRDILKAQKKDLKRTKDIQARIAWKQHFIQERSVELAHDTAQLQAAQAQASVALSRTTAPLSGQLEEVTVKVGDYVQAGKVLAILKTDTTDGIHITAHIGAERAAHIDLDSKITARYKNKVIPLEIIHLSQSSTGGESYTLTLEADKNKMSDINDRSFIEISLPLQSEDDILIPLDSVQFSTDNAEVYLAKNNNGIETVELKTITLGEVIGSYVIVTGGLEKNSKVVMSRNVTPGEKILIDN